MSTDTSSIMNELDAQDDDGLRAVRDRANGLLALRKETRKRKAAAEIRRIAKQHGLDVVVTQLKRKPGRPRKSEADAT